VRPAARVKAGRDGHSSPISSGARHEQRSKGVARERPAGVAVVGHIRVDVDEPGDPLRHPIGDARNDPAIAVPARHLAKAKESLPNGARTIAVDATNADSLQHFYDDAGLIEHLVVTATRRGRAGSAVGRNGTAEDVAQAICALIENDYISGVVLPCDGGLRLT
jgi:NAD(P)-dependent dehydrogenase (short-subunit alcohol dehydrogenase family)